jgi:hypothetical protein
MAVANLVRVRYSALAVKAEVTQGTDSIAGSPASTDYVAGEATISINPETIANPVITGSLDNAPPIIGGIKPRIQIRVPLRGSGTAGAAPDWAKLLLACATKQTDTSATVGAPTAATAGSTTSLTLATPFVATAQLYRGMPLLLSGDQTVETGIVDYTVGRVATIGETLAAAATTSTLAQIPKNNLYSPVSDDDDITSCTIYVYQDGMVWKFTGCIGTWSLELTTGGIGFLTFDMAGQFAGYTTASVPSNWTPSVLQPPRFVGGRCQLNKALAQSRTLTVNAGLTTVLPDNPEAAQGYDAALPVSRATGGAIDPLTNTVSSAALFAAFQAGTGMSLMARIGSAAGNRFLLTVPVAKASNFTPGNRDSLSQDAISFMADGSNSAVYLAAY